MKTFEIGDIVKIKDGSYMLTMDIYTAKLTHNGKYESTKIIDWCTDPFRIIAVRCDIPYKDKFLLYRYTGYVLQNMENNEIWYATDINITKLNKETKKSENYKIGDIVKIIDGSYMKTFVKKNNFVHNGQFESTETIGWCKDPFRIIAVDCKIPYEISKYLKNDSGYIIQNMKNKEVWYATDINITKGDEM